MSIFLRVSRSPSYLFLSMIVAINFSILMTHYFLIVRDGAYSCSDNAERNIQYIEESIVLFQNAICVMSFVIYVRRTLL